MGRKFPSRQLAGRIGEPAKGGRETVDMAESVWTLQDPAKKADDRFYRICSGHKETSLSAISAVIITGRPVLQDLLETL